MYPPLVWLFSAKQSYVKKDGRTRSILQKKNRVNQLQKLIDPVFGYFQVKTLTKNPQTSPSRKPLKPNPQTVPSKR
jgi:hypothetical protein